MSSKDLEVFEADGVKSFNVLLPELMSNLLHNLPGIAYRCRNDSKWTMLFLSEGCFTLTGYQPGDLLYNSERSYEDLIYEADRSLVRSSVNEAVVKHTGFKMSYRIVDKSNNIKWVWEQGNAVYDKEGKPYYLDGFITDITITKQAEESLENSARQLKELNSMKDKFFSTIAHDLQNPIYAIISLSDFINQNAEKFGMSDILDFLGQINTSAKSAHTLLENLLDWARSQTGSLKVKQERINLAKLLSECVALNSTFAHQKQIKIISDFPREMYVYSDYHLLSTVFRNLISNAIKYSFPDSEVKIVGRLQKEVCRVSIIDCGVGIAKNSIPLLGRIDYAIRALGTNNETGTGLGLVLVKDFLERLGGKLEIKSTPKSGSEFVVTL